MMPRFKLVSTFAAVVGLTIRMSSPTLATVDTTKPQPSIGILADDVKGGSISGGVLVGDEAPATSARELVADIHAHLQEVQKLVDRYQIQTAAYLRSPNVTTNYLNECPLGKYNENVICSESI